MSTIPSKYSAWKLEQLAKERGLSNSEMAGRLGVTRQAYHQYLHPVSDNVQSRTIIRICQKLNISVDEFTKDYDKWASEFSQKVYCIENVPSIMENMLNSRFVRKLLATVAREKFGASNEDCREILYMDVKSKKVIGDKSVLTLSNV